MTRISEPGIYDILAAEYHADPCPQPSLSASIAKILVDRTPAHAWIAHPRLNPAFESDEDRGFDLGSAAHAIVLEGSDKVKIIEADNYRTKEAREARDAAIKAGFLPLLTEQFERAIDMASALRAALISHKAAGDAFCNGKAEQTLIWKEGAIWCRARLDWLSNDGPIYDYKTTDGSAGEWGTRQLFNLGFDIQDAFYRRGVVALLDREVDFRFVVQETEPPYLVNVVALDPQAQDYADARVEEAIDIWRRCLATSDWPGYPAEINFVSPPIWHERRFIERQQAQELRREFSTEELRRGAALQAPL